MPYSLALVGLAVFVVTCALGCGGGGGGGGSSSVDTTPPSVTSISAPDLPTADGGNTTISAVVTDAGGVGNVYAIITKPGGSSESLTMTLASGSTYSCVFAAPLNLYETDDVYQVVVSAYDKAGNNKMAGPVSFRVPGTGGPPPPPPPPP